MNLLGDYSFALKALQFNMPPRFSTVPFSCLGLSVVATGPRDLLSVSIIIFQENVQCHGLVAQAIVRAQDQGRPDPGSRCQGDGRRKSACTRVRLSLAMRGGGEYEKKNILGEVTRSRALSIKAVAWIPVIRTAFREKVASVRMEPCALASHRFNRFVMLLARSYSILKHMERSLVCRRGGTIRRRRESRQALVAIQAGRKVRQPAKDG